MASVAEIHGFETQGAAKGTTRLSSEDEERGDGMAAVALAVAESDESDGEGEDAALLRRMRGVSYPKGVGPLYALMVAFEAPIGDAAPFEGAYVANSRALRWITRDSSKPGRARPPGDCRELWVALSTESFAREVAGRRGGAGPDAQGGARPTERQLQARARSMSPRPSRASLAAHEQPPRPQRPSRTPRRPRVVAFFPSGRT